MSSEGSAPRTGGEKRKWDGERGGHRGGRGGGGRGGGMRGGRGGRGGGHGGDRPSGCFHCKKEGHRAFECPEKPANGANSGSDRPSGCFHCKKEGHKAYECPDKPAGGERSERGGRGGGRGGGGSRNPNNTPLGTAGGRSFERHSRIPPEPTAEEIATNIAASKMDLTTVRVGCEEMPSEANVGMTEYLNATAAFSAMFKTTTRDFQVNEIGPDGVVAHVSSVTVPREIAQDAAIEMPRVPAGEAALAAILGQEMVDQFLVFCEEEKKRIAEWLAQHPRPKKPQGGEFIVHATLPKAARTEFHDLIRAHYPYIVSDAVNADYVSGTNTTVVSEVPITAAAMPAYVSAASLISAAPEAEHPSKKQKVDEPEAKKPAAAAAVSAGDAATPAAPAPLPDRKLRLRFGALLNKSDRDGRTSSVWPKDRPDYLRVTLYKENLGTMEAIQVLSTQLRLNTKVFGFAGTKDKRACTTQYVTLFKVPADKFKHLTQAGLGAGGLMKAGDYTYVDKPLRLGDLSGNEFNLVLRNVEGIAEADLQVLLENIAQRGFVNYYGMQRFGSTAIPTQAIGRALLRQDFCEALSLILMPRQGERSDITTSREYYARTRDIAGTLARMPHFMRLEQDILRMLQQQGWNAFQNAIECIPRAMRLMYVHAYQSYVWNHMVSKRIQLDARNLLVGDMVINKDRLTTSSTAAAAPKTDDTAAALTSEEAKEGDEVAKEEEAALVGDVMEVGANDSTYRSEDIHFITEEDIASNKYVIADVVLPLPGYDVLYPKNEIGTAYAELLARDGVTLEKYSSKKGQLKDFCLAGNYRKMLQVPSAMTWSFLRYSHANEYLHEPTDWDRIKAARTEEEKQAEADRKAKKDRRDVANASDAPMTDANAIKMEDIETPAVGVPAVEAATLAASAPSEPIKLDDTSAAAATPTPARPSRLFGLRVKFQLPSSTYATMLLRELMKSDTTTEGQKTLAIQHRAKERAQQEAQEQPQPDATKEEATTNDSETPAVADAPPASDASAMEVDSPAADVAVA